MDLLLTPQEHDRFAAWLEHEAATSKGLISAMGTLPHMAPLVARETAEAAAALLIARKLRATHSDNVGG